MNGLVEVRKARELTQAEAEELIREAMETERRIKRAIRTLAGDSWTLAEALYDFHEIKGWERCGFETLEAFLTQQSIELSRTTYFRLVLLWRDLVVVKRVDPEQLRTLSPNKVDEVRKAIMAGNVSVDSALADVDDLSTLELREKYGASRPARLSGRDPAVPTSGLPPGNATGGTTPTAPIPRSATITATASITVPVAILTDAEAATADELAAALTSWIVEVGENVVEVERIEVGS